MGLHAEGGARLHAGEVGLHVEGGARLHAGEVGLHVEGGARLHYMQRRQTTSREVEKGGCGQMLIRRGYLPRQWCRQTW